MERFRKKPVLVEAVQFHNTKASIAEVLRFCPVAHWMPSVGPNGSLFVQTWEGGLVAADGDWIIKGVKGEFYPCKPDVFEETYEPAQPAPEAGAEGEGA